MQKVFCFAYNSQKKKKSNFNVYDKICKNYHYPVRTIFLCCAKRNTHLTQWSGLVYFQHADKVDQVQSCILNCFPELCLGAHQFTLQIIVV